VVPLKVEPYLPDPFLGRVASALLPPLELRKRARGGGCWG
jgi:hypothetical protein